MGTAVPNRPGVPGPLLLWSLAAAGVLACAGTVLLAAGNDELYQRALRATLLVWVSLPFVLSGILAWRRRPDSAFGPLLVAAGFATLLSALQWSGSAVPNTVGQLCDLLVPALWLHVFLAYPSGRLAGRLDRALVGACYLAAVGLQVVVMLLGGFLRPHLLAVVDRPEWAQRVQNVQLLTIATLCVAGALLLWSRRRHLRSPAGQRRPVQLLVDSFAAALLMVAGLLLAGAFQWPVFEVLRLATFGVVGLAPVAFLAGLLDARLARAGIGDLLVRLRQGDADLRDLLALALRDDTLELAYWLPQYGSWADRDGDAVELPPAGAGRAVSLIERDGEQIAALVYDEAALADEPELLAAVSAAAGLALENGRLQAELRARLHELQSSRTRVFEAAQQERKRLERNLHDGAQQRLVALSLDLGQLSRRLEADPEARTRLERARGEVAVSLEELRDIARGIHPAVVTGHGLAVALESLAARCPVPLRLSVPELPRLSEPVEVAAYYVVCESLANLAKHSGAEQAAVEVRLAGGVLAVQVSDDGVGGADEGRGSGLRGLADRVEALDGTLRVWTPAGRGTCVRAEIPCG